MMEKGCTGMERDRINHGIHKDRSVRDSNIEWMRQQVEIGDTVSYPREVVDLNVPGLFFTRWEDMRIIGIYPFLVEVTCSGRTPKRHTITYAEMLANPRILKKRSLERG